MLIKPAFADQLSSCSMSSYFACLPARLKTSVSPRTLSDHTANEYLMLIIQKTSTLGPLYLSKHQATQLKSRAHGLSFAFLQLQHSCSQAFLPVASM